MIDLITGFLGSGKTTFLKKYAEYLMDQGLHIGILENDFGAINVDMLMLHELRGDQCELEMIAGGCDAESHRRRFRTKLISMRMQPPGNSVRTRWHISTGHWNRSAATGESTLRKISYRKISRI